MKSIAVIGGGASGISAAIEAKRYFISKKTECNITVYEQQNRIGKKILATGNGKCNLLNESTDTDNYNGDKTFIKEIFAQFPLESNIEFFISMGLITYTQNMGRIYPLSNQASSVLDALRFETEKLKINIKTDTKITSVRQHKNGFLLNNEYYADAVIFSGGGFSSPKQGSDGSCIKLLEKSGVKIKKCLPALTPITVKNFPKSLKGIRADGKIEIIFDNKISAFSTGELQFTEYGFSGIPAMDISGTVARLLDENKKVYAKITLIENLSAENIKNFLLIRKLSSPDALIENVLTGILNKNLSLHKLKKCNISPGEKIGITSDNKLELLANTVKEEIFEINGVKGFEFSQVTTGGCQTSQFTHKLEYKKTKGMFVTGEALDVDAKCGGYNLAWAFSTGRCAGLNSAKYILGEK